MTSVDTSERERAEARSALAGAAALVGLRVDDAELIRVGTNAVFRAGSVIARVSAPGGSITEASMTVEISRWLAQHSVAAVHALDVDQPIVVDARVVTFWHSVSRETVFGSTRDLGILLRKLHGISDAPPTRLTSYSPVDRANSRIERLAGIKQDDCTFLTESLARLRDEVAHLEFVLPAGPIHGDANVGNLLVGDDGHARLADLDGFSTGAREWDLVQTAQFFERFGWHSRTEYQDFVEAYGYDLMGWSGYPAMRDLREIGMVIWLAGRAETDPEAAAEVSRRISDIKTGRDRRSWKPF